jgi:hypothetical protein
MVDLEKFDIAADQGIAAELAQQHRSDPGGAMARIKRSDPIEPVCRR